MVTEDHKNIKELHKKGILVTQNEYERMKKIIKESFDAAEKGEDNTIIFLDSIHDLDKD